MTAAQRRRAVASGAPGTALVEPQARPHRLSWWVSQDAVRQAIGAWAATARVGPSRPTADVVRTAVAVACAIAELAAAAPVDADTLPLRVRDGAARSEDVARLALTRPVAYDPAKLAELSGASAREVDRALDVLRQAGVVSQPHGERAALVLSVDCLTLAPAVAAVAWRTVRERLTAVGASVSAPCAMLRALAERLGAVDVGSGTDALPAVRASVRDLELVTEFRRSTVSDAITALVRARLLDADARAGHTGRFVIRPAAFGLPDDQAPAYSDRTSERPRTVSPTAAPLVERALPASTAVGRDVGKTPASGAVGAPVLVGTFAGTPIYAPQGTPLVVECDADGRWSCRVGPFLQLGPVAGP